MVTFCTIYDTLLAVKKAKIKIKDLKSPWLAQGVKKAMKAMN